MDTSFTYPADVISGRVDTFSAKTNPFKTFWMAGYECSDKLNAFGERVDLLHETGHLHCTDQDYQNLSTFKMGTVREGIRWSQVEKKPYEYDWSSVAALIAAGKKNNIQQIWDLCHFGFPDDLTPLHPMFARRFASLCKAFITFYRDLTPDGELIITPINEVSFLSWLGGDVRGTVPYCVAQGWEVKYRLMKAFIEGVEVLKAIDPSVRILTTEPLVNIVAPTNPSQQQLEDARHKHEEQFQITDILAGRICPELRGKPEYLDIIGYNYYYNNQWVLHTNETLDWRQHTYDDRFVPLHQLLIEAQKRYGCPIVITETSHPKEDRPFWIKMIGEECVLALQFGIPLWGICWYPVLNRTDWDDKNKWHESGLWDGECTPTFTKRTLNVPTAAFLFNAQDLLTKFIRF
jgi:hypothetical protein